ncbi:MAG: magnesium chelatase, partial [Gemmatimonadales bacterium]
MTDHLPQTLGELKATEWASPPLRGRTVRDELRANLLRAIAAGGELFPGIVGFEDSIEPQIVNAILARHHFILL